MASEVGNYKFEKELGAGAFATVRLARHKKTGTMVAIKTIPRATFTDPTNEMLFEREVTFMAEICHQFVADFFEVIEDKENCYIVMEYASNGSLLDFVNNTGAVDEDTARYFIAQLISVLDYLHEDKKIAHRDLKAENVLLDTNNNIRLIDFGLSNVFTANNPYLQTACGSPAYVAPEMVQGEAYTIKCDIWSLGIFLYALVTGELPFMDDNVQNILKMIVTQEPHIPSTLSAPLRDLIRKILTKDPAKRITLADIKKHPWMKSLPDVTMMDKDYGIAQKWRTVQELPNGDLDLDQEIVAKVKEAGYDVSKLAKAHKNVKPPPELVLYKILKKEKTTQEMAKLSHARAKPKRPTRKAASTFSL